MSIAPIALSFALLVFWSALGWAIIAVIDLRIEPLHSLFLAPVAGVAATLLPVFWLNLAGLPVGLFARPLAIVLVGTAMAVCIWRRPPWTRSELIFLVPLGLAIVIFAFPAFRFGFDWVANANDDWANYNLSALRYLGSGYYTQPSVEAMRSGLDYPGFTWFLDVAQDSRNGSDLLLAFVGAVTGKSPFFIFMPLIVAFHAVFCLSAALIASRSLSRRRLLLAGFVPTVLAPLSLYAVHQQLIAQVVGLAFMCATAYLTFVPRRDLRSVGRIVLTSCVVAAYSISYPETVPFFGLAFLVFQARHFRDFNWGWKDLRSVLSIPVIAAVLLGPIAVGFFLFLVHQVKQSGTQGIYDGLSLFPYFLVPNGLAALFGISALGEMFREPWLSLSIAFAIVLLAFVLIGTGMDAARKGAIASFLIVIALVTAILVGVGNQFGVFKIAMFSQAFIWFAIVIVLSRFRLVVSVPIYIAIIATLLISDFRSTAQSFADEAGAGGLAGASREGLLTKILTGEPNKKDDCDVNIDVTNPSLIKLLAARQGCAQSVVARPLLFGNVAPAAAVEVVKNPLHAFGASEYTNAAALLLKPRPVTLSFTDAELNEKPVTTFRPPVEYAGSSEKFSDSTIWNAPEAKDPEANKLVFVNSSLGSHYYLPDSGTTSVFQTERDYFYPDQTIAALGRYLLFRINSPVKTERLVLDLTSSLMADGVESLPPAIVMGNRAVSAGLVGRGAARVVSPPFSPKFNDGVAYFLLDLGAQPKLFQMPRTGLMALYGRDVPIDYRRIVTFARRVEMVNSDDWPASNGPSQISAFPSDLANRNLEFSGIYEDGWIGDDGFVVLYSDKPGKLSFRGLFPGGLGVDEVELSVRAGEGKPVTQLLRPGPFVLELPVGAGRSRISFHFSKIGRLPSGDHRPVIALLTSIGVEQGKIQLNLPSGLKAVLESASGIFADGWIARTGSFSLDVPAAGHLTLRGLVPGGIGLDQQEVIVSDSSGEILRKRLAPGNFEIEIPEKPGRSKFSLSFSQEAILPAGDGRSVAALLQSIVPQSEDDKH